MKPTLGHRAGSEAVWAGERMGRNSVVGGSGSSSFTGRAPNAQMIGALVHRQSKKKKLWVSPSVGDVWLPALALVYLRGATFQPQSDGR